MSTTKAAQSTAKKSNSSSDFSARHNPGKKSEGFSSSNLHRVQNSHNTMGAFYSSGPVTSISPGVQTKFIQQKSESTEDEVESTEENTMDSASQSDSVQFSCSECEAEADEQGPDQVQGKEESEDDFVQSQAEDENEGEDADTGGDDTVQMWSCDDHEKPTCTYQTKEDGSALVQFMCAECEDEGEGEQAEQSEQDQVQSKSSEAEEIEESVGEDPVQEKCSTCESEEDPVQNKANINSKRKGSVLKEANKGLQNAHSPLPHNDAIQSSFGHHDISSIRTEVGGPAGSASERMGALAYASGDRIGFRHSPGLHLAAHEAAHTVQQRSGLKLPGNVGRPGDQWETHADRVADKVVAGESAEPLLDSVATVPAAPTAKSAAGGAHGDGISGAVQHSITSGATHQVEPGLGEDEEGAAGGESAGGSAEGGATEEGAAAQEGAAAEGGSEEAVAAEEESDPAADCAEAEGDDAEAAPEENSEGGGQQAPAEQPPSGSQKGRCYNASAGDPPPGSEEPSSDAPGNDVEGEADVEYGAWEETNDACECAAAETVPPNTAETLVREEGPTTAGGDSEAGSAEIAEEGAAAESSEGGGGAGGGGESDSESSEGSFAQGEGSRDASMAEFDAATSEVSRVPARATKLSKGLRFGAAPPGDAAQEASRAMALNQIRAFMQNASAQIEDAVAYVRDEVPMQLRAKAESVKAEIDMSMFDEKNAISARIGEARSVAIGEAANASAAIIGEHENNVNTVNTESDAAIQALNEAYTTNTDAVAAREQTSLGEVNTRFSTGRDDHEAKGTLFANAAIATGQEWVESFDHCRSGPGNDYEYNGDDGTWDGCLTVRRAKAQQESACKTASGMAENMIDISKKKGFELREQRTQYRCAVIAGAGEAQTTLDSTVEGLTAGIAQGRESSLSGLEQMRDLNLTAVQNGLIATQRSLDEQEHDQRQAINDSGYVQQVAVEQMAHQVATGLVQSVTSAMGNLEQTLEGLREKLLQGDAPAPEQLDEILASAEEGLSGGVGTLLDKMTEGATDAENSLAGAGQSAATALAEITTGNETLSSTAESGFSSEMNTLVGAASESMAQVTDGHVSNAQESATTGTEGMVQVATGFTDATERIYTVATNAITTSMGELDTELTDSAGKLEGKIAGEAWRAASKEQPAWKGVVAIVLIIIIIIVSIVVTVLTAGAAAAALGPILGAVVLGAVVGAVSAGLIQVINNWAAGDDLTKGLVQAIVMGAVGGAIGGGIGAGANGLAQVGVNAAIKAGSSTLTRAAVNVGVNLAGDMVAEGATQAFGNWQYGQKFNWQGFVTAGAMSVASTARGAGGAAGKYDADASIGGMIRPTGVSGPRPTLRAPSAADAAIGLGVGGALEGINYLATGEFDVNRFATTAAGAGGGSWAAGLGRARPGGGAGETSATATPRSTAPDVEAPTTPRAAAPDIEAPATPRTAAPEVEPPTPPRLTAPEAEAPASPRPAAPEVETPTTPRPQSDAETPAAPRRPGDVDAEGSRPRRPAGEADSEGPSPRRSAGEESDNTNGRPRAEGEGAAMRPQDGDVDLNRPAKNIDSDELAAATNKRERVGDGDHDFYVDRDGCGVCSACSATKQRLDAMLADTPAGPMRAKLEELRAKVIEVETRLARGESGAKMVQDSADVAARFKAASEEHPTLGRLLEDPSLVQTKAPSGEDVSSPHLRNLDADVVRAKTIDARDFRDIPMAQGDQAIYILRDKGSGAILKVGIAENHLGRVTQYANAGNKLGLDLELDVAIVQPRGGQSIRDIERSLAGRLSDEGHIMPWDNSPTGRLGRSDRGTPFVHPVGKDLMWDAHGNLVNKSTGAPPPASRRGVSTPDEVAQMMHQGMTTGEIARQKGVRPNTVTRWKREWRSQISDIISTMQKADAATQDIGGGQDVQ